MIKKEVKNIRSLKITNDQEDNYKGGKKKLEIEQKKSA